MSVTFFFNSEKIKWREHEENVLPCVTPMFDRRIICVVHINQQQPHYLLDVYLHHVVQTHMDLCLFSHLLRLFYVRQMLRSVRLHQKY